MSLPRTSDLQRLGLPSWILAFGLVAVIAIVLAGVWLIYTGLDEKDRLGAGASLVSTGGVGLVVALLWLQVTYNSSVRGLTALRRKRFAAVVAHVQRVMKADYGIAAEDSCLPAWVACDPKSPFAQSSRRASEAYFASWTFAPRASEGLVVIKSGDGKSFDKSFPDQNAIMFSLWQYGDTCHVGVFFHRSALRSKLTQHQLDTLIHTCKGLVLPGLECVEQTRHECILIDTTHAKSALLLDPVAWDRIAIQMAQFASHLSIAYYNTVKQT